MHAAAEEVELVGRTAQSPSAEVRSRCGVCSVVAARLGELVREAMLTVIEPW